MTTEAQREAWRTSASQEFAHALPSITQHLLQRDGLVLGELLDCGDQGCVYLTNDPAWVVKISRTQREAALAQLILERGGGLALWPLVRDVFTEQDVVVIVRQELYDGDLSNAAKAFYYIQRNAAYKAASILGKPLDDYYDLLEWGEQEGVVAWADLRATNWGLWRGQPKIRDWGMVQLKPEVKKYWYSRLEQSDQQRSNPKLSDVNDWMRQGEREDDFGGVWRFQELVSRNGIKAALDLVEQRNNLTIKRLIACGIQGCVFLTDRNKVVKITVGDEHGDDVVQEGRVAQWLLTKPKVSLLPRLKDAFIDTRGNHPLLVTVRDNLVGLPKSYEIDYEPLLDALEEQEKPKNWDSDTWEQLIVGCQELDRLGIEYKSDLGYEQLGLDFDDQLKLRDFGRLELPEDLLYGLAPLEVVE